MKAVNCSVCESPAEVRYFGAKGCYDERFCCSNTGCPYHKIIVAVEDWNAIHAAVEVIKEGPPEPSSLCHPEHPYGHCPTCFSPNLSWAPFANRMQICGLGHTFEAKLAIPCHDHGWRCELNHHKSRLKDVILEMAQVATEQPMVRITNMHLYPELQKLVNQGD